MNFLNFYGSAVLHYTILIEDLYQQLCFRRTHFQAMEVYRKVQVAYPELQVQNVCLFSEHNIWLYRILLVTPRPTGPTGS